MIMDFQNQTPNANWSTVLYDLTDNLGEELPNNIKKQNFNSLFDLNLPSHNSLLDVLNDQIQPSYKPEPNISDQLVHAPQEAPNNFHQQSLPNQKRKYHKKKQPFVGNIFTEITQKSQLQSSIEKNTQIISAPDSPKGWRQRKQLKQHIYSKNYRDKKRQRLKILEEENSFLKKTIRELQFRIHETQNELNKLKNSPQEGNKSLMQLNHKWLSKIRELLDSSAKNEEESYKDSANSYYEQYGFGGKHKIEKLQYHMDEFFENVLKDSEKYMTLTVINNIGLLGKNPDSDYPQINYTLFEIMEYDQQKIQTIKKLLSPYFKPSMERIQKSCQQLYQNFQNVFAQIYQIHEYFKKSKDKNYLTMKQKLQMESWFQENKYSKEMRQLRTDWMNSLKNPKKKDSLQFMRKMQLHLNNQL